MSTKKKLLIAFGSVVALVAVVVASIAGTVAYMTSASKVSNVFTIGNVYITLNEAAVNSDGTYVTNVNNRTDKNSYHLMPGKSYIKDPAITVAADTEACYLFLVTRNQITAIEANEADKPTMAKQMYANGWAIYKDTSAGSRVWIYCGTNTISNQGTEANTYTPVAVCGSNREPSTTVTNLVVQSESTRIPVFGHFHITTTESANLSIYAGAEVTLNAVGIQADSFGAFGSMEAVNKAWAAVVAQFPYIQDDVTGGDTDGEVVTRPSETTPVETEQQG